MKKSNNISLKNDYAFTQIMKQPKILRGILSSILHIPPEKIGTIHIKDRHLSKDLLEGKLSILDLYTVVEGTGKINIEMKVYRPTHTGTEISVLFSKGIHSGFKIRRSLCQLC